MEEKQPSGWFFYSAAIIKSFKITGIGITPEYRFYLTGSPAPKGVYTAPFVRYRNFALKKEDSNAEADFTSLGGGIVFGHQWVFRERVTLDIFLGPSYSSHKLKVKVGLPEDFKLPGLSGLGVRTGVTFGGAF